MLKLREIEGQDWLNLWMSGGVRAGKNLLEPIWDLDGKTLVFSVPSAATVTFAAVSGKPMAASEIVSQISAQAPDVAPYLRDGRLILSSSTGVTIEGGGTANAALGLPPGGVSAAPYNPPDGVAPRVLSVDPSPSAVNSFHVWTEE